MKMDKNYKTKDFYIASYLKAKGFKLAGSERKGNKVYFSFENGPEASNAVSRLFKRNETVIALEFITAFKNIKSIILNI
jgi:hypothetical protein